MMTIRLGAFLFVGLICVLRTSASFAAEVSEVRASYCEGSCPSGDSKCVTSCYTSGKAVPTKSQTPKSNNNNNSNNDKPITAYQNTGNPYCVQQLTVLYQACTNDLDSTSSNCDEKNNKGMSSVSAQASALALAFGQQTASSVQAACSKMALLSQAANAAVAGYRLVCSNAITSCRSSCAAVEEYYTKTQGCGLADTDDTAKAYVRSSLEKKIQCNDYTAKTEEAQQAIQNYAMTASNASQCASETAADENTLEAICTKNPSLSGCSNKIADCSDPSMSSNKVCVCSRNPNDPQCIGVASSGTDGGSMNMANMDMSSRKTGDTGGAEELFGDIPDTPGIQQGKVNSGGAAGIDGKQGGGVAFGSDSSGRGAGGSGKGEAKAGDEAHGAQVNSGYYGGGGSGGGWGGSGSGDGEGRGEGGLWNRISNKISGKGGPDLRQFLPGGANDPRRGIAGASGPDGITGPHSNIWQKIQNRYQVVSPSLIP